ncbi:MAG: efflux RND transporter periplasmic adaptor subunit [Candidatus Sumerlaeia bacterium]|nr:efflux RND transporter periplasmic adaptor subunit [Candidatus Sumerlaeia bacterium]
MSPLPSNPQTQDKLRSLKIDPEKKNPGGSTSKSIVFFLLGLAFGLGGAYGAHVTGIPPFASSSQSSPSSSDSSSSTQASSSVPVSTATVTPQAAPGEIILSATGYVTPRRRISLSPQVQGQVAWVGIEKGQHLQEGEILVRLDDEEYQAQLRETEARVLQAEANLRDLEAGARPQELARAKALVRDAEASLLLAEQEYERRRVLTMETNVEPMRLMEEAQASRDSALARLEAEKQSLALLEAGARKDDIEAARQQLAAAMASRDAARKRVKDTTITAPITGTVLEKLIEVGELVTPQSFGGTRGARTELLSMADLTDLQVEVDINESDFAKVVMGQTARITLDAYPDQSYEGRIREIAPEATRSKATVQVKIQILNPDKLVLPEMGARVDFLAGE